MTNKKRVLIACSRQRPSEVLKRSFEAILGEYIDFELLLVTEDTDIFVSCDLVVAVNDNVANAIARFLMEGTKMTVLRMTILKEMLPQLDRIPFNRKIIVVNHTMEMAQETISMLYEIGIKHSELVPYYPGCQTVDREIRTAITPNEEEYIPDFISETINIGDRCIDISTLLEIAGGLKLLNHDLMDVIYTYSKRIIPLNEGLVDLAGSQESSDFTIQQYLDILEDGVVVFDGVFHIQKMNRAAGDLFAFLRRSEDILELGAANRELKERICSAPSGMSDEVFEIDGKRYFVSLSYLENKRGRVGVLLLKPVEAVQRLYARGTAKKHGYGSIRYRFQDIIGASEETRRMKRQAERFARTEYPILIQGESGTGKEILAQAIHGASSRKEGPFVAFNCAALTDSLLESELFGYEEGAFTGARKSGKPGILELADGGTLFLDEIGDISLNMQAKLLRVLQEKEVVKVGGTRVIPVDIRIVSATNKDLMRLVEAERFRLDLYYRLNTLVIQTLPLRERKEDIRMLFQHFIKKGKIKKDMDREVMDLLMEYRWPGNVRELENCVAFLSIAEGGRIGREDLPFYIKGGPAVRKRQTAGVETEILKILWQFEEKGKSAGRREIIKKLQARQMMMSETQIRKFLKEMEAVGLVEISRGRGGTRITESGAAKLTED